MLASLLVCAARSARRSFLLGIGALALGAPLAAQQRGGVAGIVTDEVGDPIVEAQVLLPALRRGVLTGAGGAFELAGVPAGRWEVQVTRPGYAPERRTVTVTPSAAARVEVRLVATPLSLPALQVTATPGGRDPLAVTQSTSQLMGRELEREMAGTLAQTLRAQPGVAVRFMGPAATMPVLRGLTGDRVLVLQDGQRSADLAGSADDHGVTIDPLTAQRVELVRGPATLLYGNNALGGVVNVISGDIPTAAPSRAEGMVGVQAESAFPGAAASARGTVPLASGWAATARLGVRATDEMRIPRDPVLGDRLSNTAMRSWSGAAGVGRQGERSFAGAALKGYRFAYGLPVPAGSAPVGLDGWRVEMAGQGEVQLGSTLFPSLKADATAQDYRHDEIDRGSDRVLQSFALRTRTAGAQLRQGAAGPLREGAWGVALLQKEYAATGPEALTPPADSRGLGAFGFQEVALWAGMALQMGGRFDHYRIVSAASDKFGAGRRRDFHALSGSMGLRLPLASGASASVNVARSFRAPTVEELFSGAAHAGTGAVELGSPSLRAERGLSVEAVGRMQSARWNGQVAVYRNAVDDFVHLAAQGDTVLYGATLPVLRYAQDRAVLQGVEGSLEWAVGRALVVGGMGDWVHAERADGTPLSYMPPPRLGVSMRWDDGALSLGGDVHHEFAQNRVGAADERPTPPHTLLRLHAGVRFHTGRRTHSLSVRAENLTDEVHREATSRIKDFAPGPGRNVALVYRLYY